VSQRSVFDLKMMDKEILEEIVPPDNPAFISVKDLEDQSNDNSSPTQHSEPIDETFLIKSNQFDEYKYIRSSEQMIETQKAKEAIQMEDVNEEKTFSTASKILFALPVGRGKTILLCALAAMSLRKTSQDETFQTTRNIGLPKTDQQQNGAFTHEAFHTTQDIGLLRKDYLQNGALGVKKVYCALFSWISDFLEEFVQKTQQKNDQNYQMQTTILRDPIWMFVSMFLSLVLMDQQRASPRERTSQNRSRKNYQIIKRQCGSSPFYQSKNTLLKMWKHIEDLDDDEKEYMMKNDDTELRFEQSTQENIAILL